MRPKPGARMYEWALYGFEQQIIKEARKERQSKIAFKLRLLKRTIKCTLIKFTNTL